MVERVTSTDKGNQTVGEDVFTITTTTTSATDIIIIIITAGEGKRTGTRGGVKEERESRARMRMRRCLIMGLNRLERGRIRTLLEMGGR